MGTSSSSSSSFSIENTHKKTLLLVNNILKQYLLDKDTIHLINDYIPSCHLCFANSAQECKKCKLIYCKCIREKVMKSCRACGKWLCINCGQIARTLFNWGEFYCDECNKQRIKHLNQHIHKVMSL
jgi:hypothetical protein